ncbi:hypothetical protein MRX96_033251 [Rhipicephalus microplus]
MGLAVKGEKELAVERRGVRASHSGSVVASYFEIIVHCCPINLAQPPHPPPTLRPPPALLTVSPPTPAPLLMADLQFLTYTESLSLEPRQPPLTPFGKRAVGELCQQEDCMYTHTDIYIFSPLFMFLIAMCP